MVTSCNINFNGYSISDWKGQKTEGLFDKLKREKNNLTIGAIIGKEYEQQYFDDYSYFCDFISGKLTEQPIFSEVEKQEINLIMAYIKESGTYA